MAEYYGDIPCVKQNGIIHITKCATECLCGQKWSYSRPSNREDFKTENIIWRNLNAVTCEKCKELGVKFGCFNDDIGIQIRKDQRKWDYK